MNRKSAVHVLSVDPRVVAAARSMPAERFEVSFSSSRDEALKAMDTNVSAVVIDQELTGFAMAVDLREKYHEGVGIVMLLEREHDRWLADQARSDAVIVKPLSDTNTLIEAIDIALKSTPTP